MTNPYEALVKQWRSEYADCEDAMMDARLIAKRHADELAAAIDVSNYDEAGGQAGWIAMAALDRAREICNAAVVGTPMHAEFLLHALASLVMEIDAAATGEPTSGA